LTLRTLSGVKGFSYFKVVALRWSKKF